MKGFLTIGETDYDRGFRTGQANGDSAMVQLTIKADDVDRFLVHPQHEATAQGFFDCPAFGGKRPVLHGVFNLLVDDGDTNFKAMYYRLFFTDVSGNPLTLLGFKQIATTVIATSGPTRPRFTPS